MEKIREMNDMDRLARDVAFEIVLGGDRFDRDDVSEWMGAVTLPEKNLFIDRIKYHSVDFAPLPYRTEDFMDRSIDFWMGKVHVRDGFDIRQDFRELNERRERGNWFRFSGVDFRRCTKAVSDAMWNEKERSAIVSGPVTPFEVARAKVDALITEYGRPVRLDRDYDVLDVTSFGILANGRTMSVLRNVNVLAKGPEDHIYLVNVSGPEEKSSTLLSGFEPVYLERLIDIFDSERDMRQTTAAMSEDEAFSRSAIIGLPKDTLVTAPDCGIHGSYDFLAQSVFVAEDGTAMVSGRFVNEKTDYNFFLSDFSDRSVAVIREATDKALKSVLVRIAERETGSRKAVREKAAGRGPAI